MSFTLHVTFSGVVSLAHHPDGTGYRILVPDTLFGSFAGGAFKAGPPRKALDGKDNLDRHYPFIRCPLEAHQDTTIRCLEKEAVAFGFTFVNGGTPPMGDQDQNVADLASMPDIWDSDALDPDARADPTSHPLVTAHADLLYGSFAITASKRWTIGGHVRQHGKGDQDLDVCLPRLVVWSVPGLAKAVVRTSPYPNSPSRPREIVLDGSGADVNLMFANFPTPPWSPMAHHETPVPDMDFRWHYELLAPSHRKDLVGALGKKAKALPIPRPNGNCSPASGIRAPSGGNCMAARWF